MVKERCEVDHAFSWLSTLGGAFSALGDYFENCAETAGKISIQQLQLAFRLGRFYLNCCWNFRRNGKGHQKENIINAKCHFFF